MSFLQIDKLDANYGMARALSGINLSVDKGDITAIIGANGAGKSTLFDSIMGMVSCSGSISLDGIELGGKSCHEIVSMGVGYAPERAHLFPYMSVEDNLLAGAYTARADIAKNIELVHELFPVLRERRKQETSTQSGGERQMVSLGRALMTSPNLLLVDEPTIGLSPKVCLEIANALQRLNQEFGLTLVIAEQNVNFALTLAHNMHVIETGEVKISGTSESLKHDPALNSAYFGT